MTFVRQRFSCIRSSSRSMAVAVVAGRYSEDRPMRPPRGNRMHQPERADFLLGREHRSIQHGDSDPPPPRAPTNRNRCRSRGRRRRRACGREFGRLPPSLAPSSAAAAAVRRKLGANVFARSVLLPCLSRFSRPGRERARESEPTCA